MIFSKILYFSRGNNNLISICGAVEYSYITSNVSSFSEKRFIHYRKNYYYNAISNCYSKLSYITSCFEYIFFDKISTNDCSVSHSYGLSKFDIKDILE